MCIFICIHMYFSTTMLLDKEWIKSCWLSFLPNFYSSSIKQPVFKVLRVVTYRGRTDYYCCCCCCYHHYKVASMVYLSQGMLFSCLWNQPACCYAEHGGPRSNSGVTKTDSYLVRPVPLLNFHCSIIIVKRK